MYMKTFSPPPYKVARNQIIKHTALTAAVILILISSVSFISSHNTKQDANAAPTSIVNGNFEYAPAKNLLSHVYINSYAYVSIDAMEYWNSYACNNGLGYQTDDTWHGWTKLPSSFTAAGFGWSSTQPRLTTVTPHINANSTEIQLDINGNCYGEITTYSKGTAIYQDVATTPGAIYTWELDHCSINNTYVDKMKVLIGPPLNPTPQNALSRIKSNGYDGGITAINDGVISTPATNTDNRDHAAQWARYQGRYLVPNGQTVTRFSFQSLDQSSSVGNLVDNISFQISYPLYYNLTGGDASEDFSPEANNYAGYIAANQSVALTAMKPSRDGLTGDIINTQQVEEGSSVDESRYQLPEPQDWVFVSYDAPLDNIVSDMEITAIYEHVPIEMPDTGTHELAILTIIGSVMFATGISALTLWRKRKATHSKRHTASEERL